LDEENFFFQTTKLRCFFFIFFSSLFSHRKQQNKEKKKKKRKKQFQSKKQPHNTTMLLQSLFLVVLFFSFSLSSLPSEWDTSRQARDEETITFYVALNQRNVEKLEVKLLFVVVSLYLLHYYCYIFLFNQSSFSLSAPPLFFAVNFENNEER